MVSSKQKQENPLFTILFTYVVPNSIQTFLSKEGRLGAANALIISLIFPVGYILYDYAKRKDISYISILGLVSFLLTGIFGLYKLPPDWIAVKEASIPTIIGIVTLLSMRSASPLVKRMLFNDTVVDVDLVQSRLKEPGLKENFEKLFQESSYLLAASFLLSAILNYVLAKIILTSAPGTAEFTAELGKMNFLSWPVIALPSTAIMGFALFRLLKGIEKLTGLTMEEILKSGKKS